VPTLSIVDKIAYTRYNIIAITEKEIEQMKKAFLFFIAICLLVGLAACTNENSKDAEGKSEPEASSQAVSDESSEAITDESDDDTSVESNDASDDISDIVSDEASDEVSDDEPEKDEVVEALVGVWKRIGTEVEGDINDGGNCTITITGTSRDDLKISYDDKDFPDTRFSDKNVEIITIDPDESGQEGLWYAVVDYTGQFDTTYDFTITEEGKLEFCNNFEFDGIPMCAFEIFEKTE